MKMKRSEMVDVGIKRLFKLTGNPLNEISLNDEDYKFIANSLLDAYELEGMLPPNRKDIIKQIAGKKHIKLVNSWEPEDE